VYPDDAADATPAAGSPDRPASRTMPPSRNLCEEFTMAHRRFRWALLGIASGGLTFINACVIIDTVLRIGSIVDAFQ
jgi:hypothetical protein